MIKALASFAQQIIELTTSLKRFHEDNYNSIISGLFMISENNLLLCGIYTGQ